MRFRGPFVFLSNFAACPVRLGGVLYPSVEHAYQATKTLDPVQQEAIRRAITPAAAKRLGRTVVVRPDWEAIKLEVMYQLLRGKFHREPWRAQLLAIPGLIVEDNDWGDTFWGVCRGRGENHLGRLLMQIREELRQEAGG
jgi:ribA/ribD-fused uncharacterized protein